MSPNPSPNSSRILRSECRYSSICRCPSELKLVVISSFFVALYLAATYFLLTQISPKREDLSEKLRLELFDLVVKEVENKIDLYDAGKVYKADYALAPSGGIIVHTRCSKTYAEGNIRYSIDGILPVLWTENSPRIVIQGTKIISGECWAFEGAEGRLTIKLSRRIVPTSFTYEHVRKQLTPDLNIDSAPRHFVVRSLKNENDDEGELLGEYEYSQYDEPLQKFEVLKPNPIPTEFIELHILSNHGEMKYTALYRFRVHGNNIEM